MRVARSLAAPPPTPIYPPNHHPPSLCRLKAGGFADPGGEAADADAADVTERSAREPQCRIARRRIAQSRRRWP
eukprot:3741810-Pyramimonas_sp.AAC.1